MNRAMYLLSTGMATVIGGVLLPIDLGLAQAAPSINRLTPLQRQQIGRDLSPSGAQDFFNAGKINLEQEIRLLTKPRSLLSEPLLKVRKSSQIPSDGRFEQSGDMRQHPVK
ncbi:MAG: hypothetical protein ACAF41_15540 [Leptolyngbya sp. BL-A-14]